MNHNSSTPPLRKGDKIAIVSTARKISRQEIQPAIDTFREWGLKVNLGKHIFNENHQFAGTDEQRLADFQQALDDDSVNAIICARGGYGTVRLVDKVDFLKFKAKPKWIAGYSDATVLHSHIHANFGIETLHATMPINFKTNTNEALESLRAALFGENSKFHIPCSELNRNGTAEGALVGGNLSILYSLIGTKSDIDTGGKILFLEDLDEYLYHLDRMMMNLKRAGKLSGLAGLVVGGMTEMNDNEVPFGKTAEEIIWEHVQEYDYPVCFGFPAGHIDDNRTLILGRRAMLSVSSTATLSYE